MKAHIPQTKPSELASNPTLQALEQFWFAPVDPTLLGFIRIGIGCVALYTAFTWGIGLMGFVGPKAWVDENAVHYLTQEYPFYDTSLSWDTPNTTTPQKGFYYASPFFHVTEPVWVWTIYLSILLVIFLFTIGYQTRITGVLSWIGTLCIMQRCQPMLYGADTMINLMLAYLSIAPSGAALSVDRWLEVRRLRRLGVTRIDPPAPRTSARVALRLIQIHFCVIYLISGTAKLSGTTWWTGTALWGCIANFTFAPLSSAWYVDLLRYISQYRLLWEVLMTGGIVFTLFVEVSWSFIIWIPRMRWFCILCSLLLHTGIGPLMNLTTFSMLMMCMVLAFTPPEMMRPWLESWRRKREPTLPARTLPTSPPTKAPALVATR